MAPVLDITYIESETRDAAEKVLASLFEHKNSQGALLLLKGDLGAGKTTFVKSLGALLGVQEVIHSPTYTLCKSYTTTDHVFKNLVHIDAYRIEDNTTWNVLKMEDILNLSNTLVCVEWPDMLPKLFSYRHVMIEISHIDEHSRHLTLTFNEKEQPL